MYVPSHFAFEEIRAQWDFIDRFGFATIVAQGASGLAANHLPLMLDRQRGNLIGHMARANPLFASAAEPIDCLVVFNGPHGYVSPLWYASETGVPTWNYSALHINGRLRFIEDDELLGETLRKLVRHFDQDSEVALAKSERTLQSMLKGIVGFEIDIVQLEGKHKLSQNRSVEDRAGVVAGLKRAQDDGAKQLAEWMVELGVLNAKVGA